MPHLHNDQPLHNWALQKCNNQKKSIERKDSHVAEGFRNRSISILSVKSKRAMVPGNEIGIEVLEERRTGIKDVVGKRGVSDAAEGLCLLAQSSANLHTFPKPWNCNAPLCTFCNSKDEGDTLRKRPYSTHAGNSEVVQNWLHTTLPAVQAPSGHGAIAVSLTEPVSMSDLLKSYTVGDPVTCCSLCKSMLEKIKSCSKRKEKDIDNLVVKFLRRQNQPKRLSTCYFCEKEKQINGVHNSAATNHVRVGFEFRFVNLNSASSTYRSLCEALAFRLGLPVHVVTYFFMHTDTLCICNKHRQDNRHAFLAISLPSSTCAIPSCGTVTNLVVLRTPSDGDLSDFQDAISIGFDNTLNLYKILDKKLCQEHFALITRASLNTRVSKDVLVNNMKAFRGEELSSFVLQVLHAFEIIPSLPISSKITPKDSCALPPNLSLVQFPASIHGIIWYKDLYKYFAKNIKIKGPQQNILDRRILRRLLSSALAPFGLHFDKDPSNGFFYLFCQDLLVREVRSISQVVPGPASEVKSTPDFVRALKSHEEKNELVGLGKMYNDYRQNVLEGAFNVRDMVTRVSTWYWVYQMWTLSSERQKRPWRRVVKARSLLNPTFTWPCGNCKQNLPPGDILQTLPPSSVNLVRQVLSEIERRVAMFTGIIGPIGVGVGALIHMKGTKSLQVSLSRLGLCCSYTEMLKIRALFAAQQVSSPSMTFSKVPPKHLVCLSLDNADFSLPNSINVAGKNTNGEHFTFGSLHAMQLPDSKSFDIPVPSFKLKNPLDQFTTREALVSHFLTSDNDPDLVAYAKVLLGRVWQLRHRLQSTNSKVQISLCHLLFSSFDIFPAQNLVVIFARLEDFKVSDINGIMRLIDESVHEMLPGNPGWYEMLGVSGDFPVIWMIWKEWLKQILFARENIREVKWFPFPSGAAFHDLKVGALPTLKKLMEGALVEDLIKDGRAGLSKWYADNWQLVGNLRKNRRVNDSIIVSALLLAIPTLRAEDPDLDTELSRTIHDDPGYVQAEIDKTGSSLKVNKTVSKKVYKDGASIHRSILRLSDKYQNANFYLRVILLDLLIPTTALQVLSRCGQTSIYQKFYFNLSPFIMQTTKSSYQKHSVLTMHVLSVLPDAVIADIFGGKPGALVVNTGKNSFANMPQDETLELNIGTMKGLPIRKKELLLNAVTWCGEVSRIASGLVQELYLDGKPGSVVQSKQNLCWDDEGILVMHDREHGGATNVAEFMKLMDEKGQFSSDNLKKQYLCNILGDAAVEVRDPKNIEALLSMKISGRKKLEVLVSRIIPEYFESTWRKDDLVLMGLKKQPARGRAWTRSGAVVTMAAFRNDKTSKSKKNLIKSPAELDGEKTWSSFTKKWNSRVASLLPVIANENNIFWPPITACTLKLLSLLYAISHISSPLALCYRSWVVSLKPGFGFECRQRPAVKSSFFRALQEHVSECFDKSHISNASFLLEHGSHPSSYDVIQVDVENVGHHALQKTARSSTVGAVMEEQMHGQLGAIMLGVRSQYLKHIHLHCDYGDETVYQKGGTQAARDERRKTASAEYPECRDFNEEVSSSTIPRVEKEAFTSGYLFYGAQAALKLNKKYNKTLLKGSPCRFVDVFWHGGSFAIYDDAMGVHLAKLDIMKCPPTSNARVLIFLWRGPRPPIVAGAFAPGVTVYPRETCFTVNLKRCIAVCKHGSSLHGEAETRFVFAFNTISRPVLDRSPQSQCLIVSNDSDCPAISLACANIVKGANFVHKVSNQFIYIDSLINILDNIGIASDAVVAAFAIGENDFCLSTADVSQVMYLHALLNCRSLLGGWKYLEQCPKSDEDWLCMDLECVILTGLTFATKYKAMISEKDQSPQFLSHLNSTLSDESCEQFKHILEAWLVRLRKAIVKKQNLQSSALCLPETPDIILQGRRASFVLRYWKGSFLRKWDRESIGCVSEEWGYCTDSTGKCWPLFEREEDVIQRKNVLMYPFTKCQCTECKNRTCSCRKAGLVCIPGLCGKCEGKCTNCGDGEEVQTAAPVKVVAENEETIDDFDSYFVLSDDEEEQDLVLETAEDFDALYDSESDSE